MTAFGLKVSGRCGVGSLEFSVWALTAFGFKARVFFGFRVEGLVVRAFGV